MARDAVRGRSRRGRLIGLAAAAALVAGVLAPASAGAQAEDDPRVGLGAGWLDAETAISNLEQRAHHDKPAGFVDPANPGNFGFVTSDLAFAGDHAFVGNFNGFNIYDVSDPTAPVNVMNVVCPGGQGDMSVHGNLLFMSVEESRARVDCGTDPTVGTRFQGVRIFDISDIANPVQVAAVQTCRGSHTHSILDDPDDTENLYVYVSGTAGVRPATTLDGCNNEPATGDEPVPLAHRGHQGAAGRTRDGRGRRRPPAVHRPRHRRHRRPAERPADASPPVGHAVGADPDHRRLPRHHHVPRDRARRGRVRGQRHPDRHLRPREPRPGRRGRGSRTSPTGTRPRSTTTAPR